MIREGKRAEYTICQNAKLHRPVPAQIYSPQKTRVYDGSERTVGVKHADVIMPVLEPQNQEMAVRFAQSTQSVQTVKLQESILLAPEQIKEKPISGKTVSVKKLHCRSAEKDITLQSLFQHINDVWVK